MAYGSILKNNQNMHLSLSFQDRPMFSHVNGKLSPRPFESYGLTYTSNLKYNQNMHYSLIFQDRPTFSHINGKLSPRLFEWLKIGLSWKMIKLRTSTSLFSHPKQVRTPLNRCIVFTVSSHRLQSL